MDISFSCMANTLGRHCRNALLITGVVSLVSGCIFRDRSHEYQKTGTIPPITLPEGVRSVPLEPLYPIPDVSTSESSFYDLNTDGFVIPRPESMSAEGEKSKVKIQSVSNLRWILLEAPASQVWPLTQSFLSQVGIDVLESVPATGLVVTDWVVFKTDPEIKHQYRIRIEKGLRPESTEIHILQRHVRAGAKPTEWQERSMDADRESWLLNELANALAGDIENKAASLLGQNVGGDVKAELFMDGSEPALRLRLARERAWATLAHSVTREGYSVWDESRDLGIFYVQYIDESRKKNWFVRLLTLDFRSVEQTSSYTITDLLSRLEPTEDVRMLFSAVPGTAFERSELEAPGYLVVLQVEQGEALVKLRDAKGARLSLSENKRMLSILRRNLL